MSFLKKLFVPSKQKQELNGYESWCVRWNNCIQSYGSSLFANLEKQAEFFTSKEDAEEFYLQIKEAEKLLKSNFSNVTISKN